MGNPHQADPLVVGFAGYKGSGKTTIASAVAQNTSGVLASFGAYVRTKAWPDIDAVALADLGARLLATLGPERLVRETIETAGWDGTRALIIEGIRSINVLEVLITRFPRLHFVFVDTPERVRQQRLQKRDGLRESAIATLQAHSTESGVEALRGWAHLVVDASDQEDSAREVIRWIRDQT